MKILVACEESQAVTIELRKLGHEAYSCDLIECSGGHPEWHIQQNVLDILNPYWHSRIDCEGSWYGNKFYTCDNDLHFIYGKWDMIIAFPPCTDLAVSGARHFVKKREDGRQSKSIEFFMQFVSANCDKIVIENPIGIMSTYYRKPDQIIQPYYFGDHARKSTCLWIKGLPLLVPIHMVDPGEIVGKGFSVGASLDCARDQNGKMLSWNDPRTAKIRSKTFPGIAKAMAFQWAGICEEQP